MALLGVNVLEVTDKQVLITREGAAAVRYVKHHMTSTAAEMFNSSRTCTYVCSVEFHGVQLS